MAVKIVVAIDSQLSADTAFEHLVKQGYGAETEIHLLHVLVPGFADVNAEGLPDVAGQERKEEEVILANLTSKLTDTLKVKVTSEILTGETADVTAEVCKRLNADEVVIPSHARHGFSRLWFGSVADQIVDAVPCAALVLKMPQPKLRN